MAQLKAGTTIGGRNIVQELDSHKNDYATLDNFGHVKSLNFLGYKNIYWVML